jgi:hypothetical protein
MGKRYREVEFGVWVEEPDPLAEAPCDAAWNGAWDHVDGPRPRCFRSKDHDGEHHETRPHPDGSGWIEFYWTEDPEDARTELRRSGGPDRGAG